MYNYEIIRGDIYYIAAEGCEVGCEQRSGRPAIIVSNNEANKFSPVVEIVYLTTREKKDLPTHVSINTSKYNSTALCEQITTVSKDRVGDYIGMCSEEELARVDEALLKSLDIEVKAPKLSSSNESEKVQLRNELKELMKKQSESQELLTKVTAERDVYKELYLNAISKIANI